MEYICKVNEYYKQATIVNKAAYIMFVSGNGKRIKKQNEQKAFEHNTRFKQGLQATFLL